MSSIPHNQNKEKGVPSWQSFDICYACYFLTAMIICREKQKLLKKDSKKVDLLANVFDHCPMKFKKGIAHLLWAGPIDTPLTQLITVCSQQWKTRTWSSMKKIRWTFHCWKTPQTIVPESDRCHAGIDCLRSNYWSFCQLCSVRQLVFLSQDTHFLKGRMPHGYHYHDLKKQYIVFVWRSEP